MVDMKKFCEWVQANYPVTHEPPPDWNPSLQPVFKIGGVNYGPVNVIDIPDEFLTDPEIAEKHRLRMLAGK